MICRSGALLALVAALLTGCRTDGDWHPSAPFAPSLRPAFGARETNGQLQIWTGSRCVSTTRLGFTFEPNTAALLLDSATERGVEIERITFGGDYPGMKITDPLPEGFDWHNEKSLMFAVNAQPVGWGSKTDLAEVITGSDQHPPDTYWFQGVGWLNPAEVAAKDGKTFLATCTPDPGKQQS